jgi:hypothetical protein
MPGSFLRTFSVEPLGAGHFAEFAFVLALKIRFHALALSLNAFSLLLFKADGFAAHLRPLMLLFREGFLVFHSFRQFPLAKPVSFLQDVPEVLLAAAFGNKIGPFFFLQRFVFFDLMPDERINLP